MCIYIIHLNGNAEDMLEFTRTHTHAHLYTNTHFHHAHTHNTHTQTNTHTHTHTRTDTHINTHTHKHKHTHKPTHTHTPQELAQLQKYEFLGGSTRGVFVELTAYFPGEYQFATVSILFEMGPADVVVHPSISVRVSDFQHGPRVQTYYIKRDLRQKYQDRPTTNMSKETYICAKKPVCKSQIFSTAHGYRQIYQKRPATKISK